MPALKKMIPYNTLLIATAALRMAVELGNEEALEILLHGGADPDYLGAITDEEKVPKNQLWRCPLLNASSCGHLSIVERLVARWPHVLKKSAENNSNNKYNTRRIRTFYTRGEIAHMLIDWGADVEAVGHRNKRPLQNAAGSRAPEYVSALLARGASVDPSDSHGRTPLTRAVIAQDLLTVQVLLDAGADVDSADITGRSPLHHGAALFRGAEIVSLLITAGADIDAQNGAGNTPVHCAGAMYNLGAARVLLDAGACLDVVNGGVMSAGDVLERFGFMDVEGLLLEGDGRDRTGRGRGEEEAQIRG
ncbi:ankyrin repeat-containing domain protein [Aspergillus venezuelensis]